MALVPFSYNLRSLFVRKSTTILTIASTGATVAVLAGVLSLQQGFETMFTERGRTDLAVFLRPGAESEGNSAIRRNQVEILVKGSPEIALDQGGKPLASAEVYTGVRLDKIAGGQTNVPVRGVQQQSFAIHGDDMRIVEGRTFAPGSDEVIVGRGMANRIAGCQLGGAVQINTVQFQVVGIFESKGGYRSEIWGDGERMLAALDRGAYSRVIAVLKDDTQLAKLQKRLENDKQVPAKIFDEQTYLANQTGGLTGTFMVLGILLGVIMGLGALFTGTNAMLSAISSRVHEIGILLSIGFRPPAVFFAFLLESILVALIGGLVGCILVLPLNGIETGTTNMTTFSEVTFSFRTTPKVLIYSVLFAAILGLLGGAIPAWKASRMEPTNAMRRG